MFNLISLDNKNSLLLTAALLLLAVIGTVRGQQTTAFTYQGRLTDGGTPATGSYDLQFALWHSLSGGTQIGSTQTVNSVSVANGIFTVTLDFGSGAFSGANRFLEISVRAAGPGSFTLLSPRQQIASTPYAVRSLGSATADLATNATNANTAMNATQLGGVPANQYVLTTDSRLSDARPPTPGSSNYIQNTTSLQGSSNFNISGNGTAGGTLTGAVINSTSVYDINGLNVLSTPGFFGAHNLFLGEQAGAGNTGGSNTFLGNAAGNGGNSGNFNVFVGKFAGSNNTSGAGNTAIGYNADVGSNLPNATAIGANAQATHGNTMVLGSISGVNGATADTFVGIGTINPSLGRLHVEGGNSSTTAIVGRSTTIFGTAVEGIVTSNQAYAIHGVAPNSGNAGFFEGNVHVTGTLTKGGGSFKIDHPLDPANKYLSHSFVESPDMMNIYNGSIITDARGFATVLLPDYFTALNRDFRYQLTVIGRFAQAIVARKVKNNRFVIRTSKPHTEVSWQVTGIRQDAYANAHRIKVEEEKTGEERGRYLHPKLFGQPEDRSIEWARKPKNVQEKEQVQNRER